MKLLYTFLFLFTICMSFCKVFASVVYASNFNSSVTCNNPFVLEGTTTLMLDEDVILTSACIPVTTSVNFLSTDQLIISSTIGASLIISSGVLFDLSAFLSQGQQLIITGNAQLVVSPGAIINFNSNQIVCMENGKFLWMPAPI
jgi:hypothetical protein